MFRDSGGDLLLGLAHVAEEMFARDVTPSDACGPVVHEHDDCLKVHPRFKGRGSVGVAHLVRRITSSVLPMIIETYRSLPSLIRPTSLKLADLVPTTNRRPLTSSS